MTNNIKDDRHLGYFVVAYIDLLGQQDRIRCLNVPKGPTDLEAIKKAGDVIRDTYGAVKKLRKSFEYSFKSFAESPIQKNLPPDLNNGPIKIQSFSDSIVIYLSLRNDQYKLPVRGIYAILCASAVTFLECLAAGHPIRGGIDIGAAFEPEEGEIYGAALSRAYTLESKYANYPRIILGNELVHYLQASCQQEESDIYASASKKAANMCRDLLVLDDDGIPFIDYLGPNFKKLTQNKFPPELIKKAYEYVIKSSDSFKENRNSKLAFRYTLLRNYFEERLNQEAE